MTREAVGALVEKYGEDYYDSEVPNPVRGLDTSGHVDVERITLRLCTDVERDHMKSLRQYAHVGHFDGVICVCEGIFGLPYPRFWALIAHEVGHMLAGYRDGEELADKMAGEFFNVVIRYSDGVDGKRLQGLTFEDAEKVARRFPGFERQRAARWDSR